MSSTEVPRNRHVAFVVAALVCLGCFSGFFAAWREFGKDIAESRQFGSVVTTYLAQGRVNKALRMARIACEDDPLNLDAAAAYAKALAAAGKEPAAMDQYQRLLNISVRRNPKYDPDKPAPEAPTLPTERPYFFPVARLELAKRDTERGELSGALRNAELAQAFGQRIPKDYWDFLFGLYGALGLWGRAFSFQARDRDPSQLPSDAAMLVFARCAAARGAWDDCRAAAEAALRRTDVADAHWWLGVAWLALGRDQSAADELRAAADAGHPDAPFFLGWARERLGEKERLDTDYLRTAPDSLYRPFALAKAMETPPGNAAPGEPPAALERELERYFGQPRPLPRPFMSDEARVHPVGLAIESNDGAPRDVLSEDAVGDASIPALLQVVWVDELAPEGAERRSVRLDESRPLEPLLQNGRYVLEVRLAANLVPFGTFAGAEEEGERAARKSGAGGTPPVPGLFPGWPPVYALPKGEEAEDHFETVVQDGAACLRVVSDDARAITGAGSVFVPVEPGRHYVLAARCRSQGAKLYAGWEWYDANEARVYAHNVFNQEVVAAWNWRTQYHQCPVTARYARAAAGVHRSIGTADFDAILVFPVEPPPFPW